MDQQQLDSSILDRIQEDLDERDGDAFPWRQQMFDGLPEEMFSANSDFFPFLLKYCTNPCYQQRMKLDPKSPHFYVNAVYGAALEWAYTRLQAHPVNVNRAA